MDIKTNINEILEWFSDCDLEDDLAEDNYMKKVVSKLPQGEFCYAAGVTKVVIIPKEGDYVLKIPFSVDEYGDFFENAGGYESNGEWDYCEAELEKYKYAKEEGVDEFFLETEYLCQVQEFPIYIQRKAVTFYSIQEDEDEEFTKDHEKWKSKTKDRCNENNFYCFNVDWLADVLAYYGENKFDKFMQFLEDYDITDLHKDNVGYCGDQPVIMDWGGYFE